MQQYYLAQKKKALFTFCKYSRVSCRRRYSITMLLPDSESQNSGYNNSLFEPGYEMYCQYFCRWCLYVRVGVRRKNLNMISARDIIGVATSKPLHAGPNFPQFFHVFGDSVYAYHDFAMMMVYVHYQSHNRL